jgi:hypothetical protein
MAPLPKLSFILYIVTPPNWTAYELVDANMVAIRWFLVLAAEKYFNLLYNRQSNWSPIVQIMWKKKI